MRNPTRLTKPRKRLTANDMAPDKADAIKNLLMRRGLERSPMPMINAMNKRGRNRIVRD